MKPSISNATIKQRPSVDSVTLRNLDPELLSIDYEIGHVQKQLDQLAKENRLMSEKEAFLLQNLKFRRNKKVIVQRNESPRSETLYSFENIDLDDQDKVSIVSADLYQYEESSSSSEEGEEEEEEVIVRKKPQVPNSNLKNMLKAFLAPEEDSSEEKQKIDGEFAPKSSFSGVRGDSFSTAAESMCQYMECKCENNDHEEPILSFSEKVISCM